MVAISWIFSECGCVEVGGIGTQEYRLMKLRRTANEAYRDARRDDTCDGCVSPAATLALLVDITIVLIFRKYTASICM